MKKEQSKVRTKLLQERAVLREKLYRDIEEASKRDRLISDLEKEEFQKNKIAIIAENHGYHQADLEEFYENHFLSKIIEKIDFSDLGKHIIEKASSLPAPESSYFKFVKSKLNRILEKALYLSFGGGFSVNILRVEPGVFTANAGDSAQFLFLGRAILAGFNCSNVDVRSSKYDAIIDYNNKLLKVQVKGISSSSSISFWARARGGQGIDYKHERNQGKRVTSNDCDIFVAVDKQLGICYLIPMKDFADKLTPTEARNVRLSELTAFRENWDVVKKVAV